MSASAPGRRAPVAAAFAAALAFLPTVAHGFVYDDHRFLEANDALTRPSVLWRAFLDPSVQTADGTHAGLWRPLRTLSFALDRLLFGKEAWGPHLENVLLHGVATGLVAALLGRLGAGPRASFAGALVFALHPVQVECVAWVSSRGDLLALVGVLGALLLALRDAPRLAAACGACALLAKEQAVVWPALVVATWLAAGRRLRAGLRAALVPAIVVAAFVAVRHALLSEPFQEGGLPQGGPGGGELLRMLGVQTWTALLPVDPLFDWQMPEAVRPLGGPLLLAFAALPFVALPRRATRPAALWFLAALVPTLFVQVLVPLNIRVADRFLLFALPALALLVARAVERSSRVLAPTALAVLALAGTTLVSAQRWASDRTLWTDTLDRSPGHWRAVAWLGGDALVSGDARSAVSFLTMAKHAAPSDAKTRFQLALALQARAQQVQSPNVSGDDAHVFLQRARDEYAAALVLYGSGRQEGGARFRPLALVGALDITVVIDPPETARAALEGLLGKPRDVEGFSDPTVRAAFEVLLRHVAELLDPNLSQPLAPRLREWGGL